MAARPTVSLIVPFAGSERQLSELLERLADLDLRLGDEVWVADNRPDAPDPPAERGAIRVLHAAGVSSPAFARNRAAAHAGGEWLVLIDADTEPDRTLLDDYFSPLPRSDTAVLAGAIVDRPGGAGPAARHAAARAQMSQQATLSRGRWSYAQTANCAIRRDAFVRVGGFEEDARAGEDADLCFRLRAEGYGVEPRPGAVVAHRTRATLRELLGQLARHGSGAAWVERRHPGAFPRPGARSLMARIAGHVARAAAAGIARNRARVRAELLNAAEATAFEFGRHLSNRARRHGSRR